jgi:hypothetical protein
MPEEPSTTVMHEGLKLAGSINGGTYISHQGITRFDLES